MRHPFESRLTGGPAPLSTIVVSGDPDEDARLILASGLTYAGYRLRLAGTGDELLREARGDDVSLVIAEVDLPCAAGPCAIEVLKRTPELRRIPVLAYSTHTRVVSEARALSSGADRFLGDPTHLSAVFDAVASMHVSPAHVADTAGRPAIPADTDDAIWADDGGRTPAALLEEVDRPDLLPDAVGPASADRANAGAMVSRAHRAEQSSGGSRRAGDTTE